MFNYEVNNIHKMLDIKSKFLTLMTFGLWESVTPIGNRIP